MPKSLYQRLVEAGVETSNHCSDLYFKASPESGRIVEEARADGVYAGKPKPFKNEVTGEPWLEAPFQFDPYWEARSKR